MNSSNFIAQNNEPSEKKRKFVKKKATFDGNPTDVISDAWDEGSVLVMMSSLQVTIHPIRDREDPNDINRKLEELQPQAIILYNAEVNAVRKIEVRKNRKFRILKSHSQEIIFGRHFLLIRCSEPQSKMIVPWKGCTSSRTLGPLRSRDTWQYSGERRKPLRDW